MKFRILLCISLACITAGCSDQPNAGDGDQLVPPDVHANKQADAQANSKEDAETETTANTTKPTVTATITVAYEIHVPTRDDLRNALEFDP